MKYISKNHSKYLLMCHLIFVCKYHKRLLSQVGYDIKTEVMKQVLGHRGMTHPLVALVFQDTKRIKDQSNSAKQEKVDPFYMKRKAQLAYMNQMER